MKTKNFTGLFAILMIFLVSATAGLAAESLYGLVTDVTATPVSGANVENYDSGSVLVNSTTTDANGTYVLNFDVATGLYTVNISAAGLENDTFVKVIINDDSYEVNRTLGPIAAGIINGTITDGGVPVSGVSVRASGSNIYTATTDALGEYSITAVPGTYTVSVSKAGYADNSTSGVSVTDATTTTVDMEISTVSTVGTIRGAVNNFTNNSQYLDNAIVTVTQGNATVAITLTDAFGNYSVTVSPGTYTVTVSKIGFYDGVNTGVDVTAGTITDLDFSLIEEGSVCSQEGPYYGAYGACVGGVQSRTVTYYNYTNVCGYTYVTNETLSCGGSSGGTTSGGSSSRGGSSAIGGTFGVLPFTSYVTHIYDSLLAERGAYIMSVDSETIAIYEIEFAVKDDVRRNVVISVGELLERPKKNLEEGEVYQYNVINRQNVNNEEFSYVKARFKVLKTWFAENDVNLSSVELYRYDITVNKWVELPTRLISEDASYYYFESDLPGMSEFAIAAKQNVVPVEETPVVEPVKGLSEEEIQELMNICTENGQKPVPVIGEDGEVLDIECEDVPEEVSALGKAWGVFKDFVSSKWKWILVAIAAIFIVAFLIVYGPKLGKEKTEETKDKKEKKSDKKKAEKKEVKLDGITNVNVFTRMFRHLKGYRLSKSDSWFNELNDKEFERLVKERRKARLERRKKALK